MPDGDSGSATIYIEPVDKDKFVMKDLIGLLATRPCRTSRRRLCVSRPIPRRRITTASDNKCARSSDTTQSRLSDETANTHADCDQHGHHLCLCLVQQPVSAGQGRSEGWRCKSGRWRSTAVDGSGRRSRAPSVSRPNVAKPRVSRPATAARPAADRSYRESLKGRRPSPRTWIGLRWVACHALRHGPAPETSRRPDRGICREDSRRPLVRPHQFASSRQRRCGEDCRESPGTGATRPDTLPARPAGVTRPEIAQNLAVVIDPVWVTSPAIVRRHCRPDRVTDQHPVSDR